MRNDGRVGMWRGGRRFKLSVAVDDCLLRSCTCGRERRCDGARIAQLVRTAVRSPLHVLLLIGTFQSEDTGPRCPVPEFPLLGSLAIMGRLGSLARIHQLTS